MDRKHPSYHRGGGWVSGMYLFGERKGRTVHNATNLDDTLTISERFKPVPKKDSLPLLVGYTWNLSSAQDIITNILGFIPFGFFFSALLIKNIRLEKLPIYLIIAILARGSASL